MAASLRCNEKLYSTALPESCTSCVRYNGTGDPNQFGKFRRSITVFAARLQLLFHRRNARNVGRKWESIFRYTPGCLTRRCLAALIFPLCRCSPLSRRALYLCPKGALLIFWASSGSDDFSADTLVNVFSSGKSLESILMAMLVDQGLLDFTKPVSAFGLNLLVRIRIR